MHVLLLGGTGFLGAATRTDLLAAGHVVRTVSRSAAADVVLDATDADALGEYLDAAEFDAVVNLLGAGLSAGTADPRVMQRINADLPAEVFDRLGRARPGSHFVHLASSTERLPGQAADESAYSASKHAGTDALRRAAAGPTAPLSILTVHNTYGPQQPERRFVAYAIAELRRRNPVLLAYPDRVRDFVHVSDVAECVRFAVEHPPTGLRESEVGTGSGTSLADAARTIARMLGRPEDLVGATLDRPVDVNPVTVAATRHGSFGLCSTDFDEGIHRTIQEA